VCEDCNDVLLKHYKLETIDEEEASLKTQIAELEEKASSAKTVADKIEKQYSAIQTLVKRSNDYMEAQNSKKIKMAKLAADLERLEENLKAAKSSNEMFGELVLKHTNELNGKIELYKSIETRKKYLTLAEHVVSEDGVKKFIVKDVISTINNLVKKYLLEIGAEFIVVFDETFDYKFLTKSGECEYSSLSKGERQRLTVAMLFAFKDIISMDGIDSNVFIIDEILDDGLDESGIKAICSILKTRCCDKKQAAYIISHRAELADSNYFNTVVEVVKHDGITRLNQKSAE
jgi:DNA repair exonuclease SbcCD ATPase subunit